jgi:hypothetical protein
MANEMRRMYSLSEGELVLLNEGRTNVEAAGLEESEDHATTDDELVALAHEGVDHTNLGGNLQVNQDQFGYPLGALSILGKKKQPCAKD